MINTVGGVWGRGSGGDERHLGGQRGIQHKIDGTLDILVQQMFSAIKSFLGPSSSRCKCKSGVRDAAAQQAQLKVTQG